MTAPLSSPRTIRTRAEMTPEYFETLSKMLRSQAYRELAAAVVFAEAIALVPTLEECEQAVEVLVQGLSR